MTAKAKKRDEDKVVLRLESLARTYVGGGVMDFVLCEDPMPTPREIAAFGHIRGNHAVFSSDPATLVYLAEAHGWEVQVYHKGKVVPRKHLLSLSVDWWA